MYPERAAHAHRAYVREAGIDLPLNFETAAAGAQSAKRRKTAAACRTLAAAAAIAAETERVAAEAGARRVPMPTPEAPAAGPAVEAAL